jgi:hypothetical protein
MAEQDLIIIQNIDSAPGIKKSTTIDSLETLLTRGRHVTMSIDLGHNTCDLPPQLKTNSSLMAFHGNL